MLDGLMSLSSEDRRAYLKKLMEGVKPAYKITQSGDPIRQHQLRATLPNVYNTIKMDEVFGELQDTTSKTTPMIVLDRAETKQMCAALLDIEMSACGGG